MATARQLEEAAELARKAEEAEAAATLREDEARKLTEAARQERLSADQKRAAANASHSATDGSTGGSGVEDRPFYPSGVGGGAGGPPLRTPIVRADPPLPNWWNNPWWAAVAVVALILALIALGLWLNNRDGMSAMEKKADTALTTAKKADAKADKAIAAGEANTKAIGELSQKQADFQTSTKQELDKKCDCDKKPPAATPPKRQRQRQPAKAEARAEAKAEARAEAKAGVRTGYDLWKWRFPDSSASNPKACFVEYLTGEPKPAHCSTLLVVTPAVGESRSEWRARVTSKMGLVNPHTF